MPMGKSEPDIEEEVSSERFPPCFCAKILYTSPEEKRVTPALLQVNLLDADVNLTFSCTFKEEPSEWLVLCCATFVLLILHMHI